RSWCFNPRCRKGPIIRRASRFASSGECRNDAGLRVDSAHTVIENVAYINVARSIKSNAVRLIELSLRRGTAVTGKPPALRSAGNHRDDSCLQIDAPDDIIIALNNIQIACVVESEFMRVGKSGRR